MRIMVLIGMIVVLSSASYAQSFVEVCIDVNGTQLRDTCLEAYQGEPRLYIDDPFQEYFNAMIYSFNDVLLHSFNFSMALPVHHLDFELQNYEERLSFPYFRDMKEMQIWDGRQRLLVVDLSSLATCNTDGICDLNENERTCPEDCKEKFAIIADDTPDVIGDISRPEKGKEGFYMLFALIILASIMIFLIILKRKKQ